MLRVTFEIIPYGQTDHPNRRQIGELIIGLRDVEANIGEYESRLETDGLWEPKNSIVYLTHHRDEGAFKLVKKCLEYHNG